MTRLSIANELEQAADQIADISRADLQVILRRAANAEERHRRYLRAERR